MKKIEIGKNKTFLKIVSLLLAAVLWIYVVSQSNLTTSSNLVNTKLEYYNIGESLSVEGPSTVGVRVWGVQSPGTITAYVDLAGLSEGNYTLDVKVKPVEGALLTRVEPDKIEVRIAEQQKRVLPIQHVISENPPDGYNLTNILIIPEKCVIQGEEQYIKNVASIVVPLNLKNKTSISEDIIGLEARDQAGNVLTEGIHLVPESVQVYSVIEAQREKFTMNIRPQVSGNLADGYILKKVTVEPAQVSVVGEKSIIDRLGSISTQNIDLQGLSESFTTFIDLQVDPSIIAYPSNVKVTVEIEKNNEEGTR